MTISGFGSPRFLPAVSFLNGAVKTLVLAASGLLLLGGTTTASAAPAVQDTPTCTLVLGFSQTADWYMAPASRSDSDSPVVGAIFESIVDGDRWQLKWAGGAGVNVYSNPDAGAWGAPIISPCVVGSGAPERIVYMISGPFGEDVPAWAAEIEKALDNIRDKFPSAEMIALQSVVGAPADAPGDECFVEDGGQRVRASWQATPIIEAIRTVAAGHDDVLVGATTRLLSCDGFVDALGHISNGRSISGASYAAVTTGLFYRDFKFKPE